MQCGFDVVENEAEAFHFHGRLLGMQKSGLVRPDHGHRTAVRLHAVVSEIVLRQRGEAVQKRFGGAFAGTAQGILARFLAVGDDMEQGDAFRFGQRAGNRARQRAVNAANSFFKGITSLFSGCGRFPRACWTPCGFAAVPIAANFLRGSWKRRRCAAARLRLGEDG